MADEQFLVLTPTQLREILDAHGVTQARTVMEQVLDTALRTEVLDGSVVPPLVSVLAELAHQVSVIADSTRKPPPTITEESAIEAWKAVLPIYEDKAVPFLDKLGIDVEREPQRRI